MVSGYFCYLQFVWKTNPLGFNLDLKNLVTVTTQLHQEEVESSEEVQMIEQIEQIETEIEEEEIEEETVFTLDLTDDSECEDKEYLGKN